MAIGVIRQFSEFMGAYWTRGEPGREGLPQRTVAFLYKLWVLAFALKLIGASADISFHFKYLFDAFSWPHNINMAGDALGIAGVIFHTYTGYGMDKASLRLSQWGLGIFVVAAPLDALNHTINGLDITTWAPAHFLLYTGTAIWGIGVCRGAMRALEPGRFRNFVVSAFCFIFLDNVMFPNGQQEYGIIEIQNWLAKTPEGSPTLLQFAATQFHHPVDNFTVEHFALPIPSWFYPVYGILGGALTLLVVRKILGTRFAATRIALSWVAFKCVAWPLLYWVGLTRSAVPFWVISLGLGVDLAVAITLPRIVRIVLGSAVITALGYGALALQSTWQAPPVDYQSAPETFVALALLWFVWETWGTRYYHQFINYLARPREPAVPAATA